jgi:hypothetical protein
VDRLGDETRRCRWKEVSSMRLTLRDLGGTVLVAAIGVPYVGYLVNGDMPFIKDPRGMSATGLILGVAAFFVLRYGDTSDRIGMVETGIGVVSLALGIAALAFAETAAADVLLAVFMGAILVVWATELLDPAGVMHHQGPRIGLTHS